MGDFQNSEVNTKSKNSIIRVVIHDSVPILRLSPFSSFVLRFPRYLLDCFHKTKQARITCIVPRSVSHEAKEARFRKKSENRTIQSEICYDLCKIGQWQTTVVE